MIVVAIGSGTGLWFVTRANRQIDLTNQQLEQANQSLSSALDEAQQSFQLSQDVLNGIVNQIRDELYDIPKAGTITLQAVRNSVDLQQRLLKIRPNSRETAEQLVSALNICRLTEWNQGDTQASQITTKTLQSFVGDCLHKYPGDLFFELESIRLALDALGEKSLDQQQSELDHLRIKRDQLLAGHGNDYRVHQVAGLFEQQRINLAAAKGDLNDVLEHAKKRVEYGQSAVRLANATQRESAQSWLLQSLIAYCEFLLAAQDVAGVQHPLSEATELVNQLAHDASASSPNALNQKARVNEIRGLAAQRDSRQDNALSDYNEATTILRQLVDDYPTERSYRTSLMQVQLRSVSCLIQLDRKPEAAKALEKIEPVLGEALKQTPDDFLYQRFQQQVEQLKELATSSSPPNE